MLCSGLIECRGHDVQTAEDVADLKVPAGQSKHEPKESVVLVVVILLLICPWKPATHRQSEAELLPVAANSEFTGHGLQSSVLVSSLKVLALHSSQLPDA